MKDAIAGAYVAAAWEHKPGDRMIDKTTIRYLGYRTLADGGRGFDFSIVTSQETGLITIEASPDVFRGPNKIEIQEGAGICYETLRSRVTADSEIPPHGFSLDSADSASTAQEYKGSC